MVVMADRANNKWMTLIVVLLLAATAYALPHSGVVRCDVQNVTKDYALRNVLVYFWKNSIVIPKRSTPDKSRFRINYPMEGRDQYNQLIYTGFDTTNDDEWVIKPRTKPNR